MENKNRIYVDKYKDNEEVDYENNDDHDNLEKKKND